MQPKKNEAKQKPQDIRFNIYTAIDIMDEKCVRLYKGDFDHSETYNNDPCFVAKRWQSMGAKFLHVVDLDGARSGRGANIGLIKLMINEIDIPIEVGGGIRSMASIEKILEAGAERVILGSTIIKDPALVKEALKNFGGKKIVLGIDCKAGYLAIEGWKENSKLKAIDVVHEFKEHGLEIIHFTDIDRDGTLEGPNIEGLIEFLKQTNIKTISSGGVSSMEDVFEIKSLIDKGYNVDGVIIGKALYTGKIKPTELYRPEVYS